MAEKDTKESFVGSKIPGEVREHMRAARDEFRESIRSILPPEFTEHRRKARKEMLLAWRSLIDSALERLAEKDV